MAELRMSTVCWRGFYRFSGDGLWGMFLRGLRSGVSVLLPLARGQYPGDLAAYIQFL